ncbi:glycosyltransferase family 39 protein [Verrucomicrobia bacterium]|nr:glycosyltransferase family 39 protein [Verrucomicrobiota bacterium]
MNDKKHFNWFIGLIILAFVVRLLWNFYFALMVPNALGGANWVKEDYSVLNKHLSSNPKGLVSPDFNQVYHPLARSLVESNKFSLNGKPTAYVGPGYPFYLSLIYRIFGENVNWIRISQVVLSILTCVCCYYLGLLVHGKKLAIYSLFAASIHPLLFYQDALLLTECLFTLLHTLAILFIVIGVCKNKYIFTVIGGICLGLACYVRPNPLLFPGIVIFSLWILKNKNNYQLTKHLLVASCALLIIVSSWIYRNYIHFQKFIPMTGIIFHFYEDPSGVKSEHEIKTNIFTFLEQKFGKYFIEPIDQIKKVSQGGIRLLYKTNSGKIDIVAIILQSILFLGIMLLYAFKLQNKKSYYINIIFSISLYYFITLTLITKSTLVRYFIPIYPLLLPLSIHGYRLFIRNVKIIRYKKFDALVLSTVHPIGDTRIYLKQIPTLIEHNLLVTYTGVCKNHSNKLTPSAFNFGFKSNRFIRILKNLSISIYLVAFKRYKILHIHDPELIIVGIFGKIIGKKVIYDVHENYPSSILDRNYLNKHFKKTISHFVRMLERTTDKLFDAIITATDKIGEQFLTRNLIIIHNYPSFEYEFLSDKLLLCDRKFDFVYVGVISKDRGLFSMLDIIKELNKICQLKEYRLQLIGRFNTDLLYQEAKHSSGWQYVDYHGVQNRSKTLEVLNNSKYGFVLFHESGNHIHSEPNKMFEYMASGCVVFCSDFPHWKTLINREVDGLNINYAEIEASAMEISRYIDKLDQSKLVNVTVSKNKYNWNSEGKKLVSLYQSLLK